MEASILESIGVEIIGVMSPVSICMLLVVLLVYSLSPTNPFSSAPIRTAANLVYLETPSDSTTQKFEGALLNALVFVILIGLATFFLVLLYYYNFTSCLKNYMRFSAFTVLAMMGGSIFLSIVQHFSIPVDSITCFLLLFNFTVVGVLSVMSGGIPIFLRQTYMVVLGIIVAAWFTRLPEWTTWVLLVALALYDLAAVLAPGGPLKLLVELASSRDEELPALVYEARPTVAPNAETRRSLGLLVGGAFESGSGSVELQGVSQDNGNGNDHGNGQTYELNGMHNGNENDNENDQTYELTAMQHGEIESNRNEGETTPLVGCMPEMGRSSSSSGSSQFSVLAPPPDRSEQYRHQESEIIDGEEMSPLVGMLASDRDREQTRTTALDSSLMASRGIKLGLGDFVFYSVLVGRAAMYDLMTVYACYLAIISGLGCTLILLSVCRKALPALPISIALGVMFYFLTRLLMEPFIVGTATSLLMF